MKVIALFFIISFLLFSCKKEKLTNNISGSWYFIEAYETDEYEEEYNLLSDYENITLTFNNDNSFLWLQDGIEYEGTYNIGNNKITLDFDNSDQEIWKNYRLNKNKNTLSYNYYNHNDSNFQFKLKKVTTNYSRR